MDGIQAVSQVVDTQTAPQVTETEPVISDTPFDELSAEEQLAFIAENFSDEPEEDDDDDQQAAPVTGEAQEGKTDSTGEKEPAEKGTEPQAADNGTEAQYYAPEEFLQLNPVEVDSSKLPPAARLVHDRYMQSYNAEVAPAMQELAQLRQFRDRVLQSQGQPQTQAPQPEDAAKAFIAAVKTETARRLGLDKMDDFNAEHQMMAQFVASEMAQARAQQMSEAQAQKQQSAQVESMYNKIKTDLAASDPDFAAIDHWAMQELQNLPFHVVRQVQADFASGDEARIKGVYKIFKDRYVATRQAQTQAPAKQAAPVAEPPKVLSGSHAASTSARGWDLTDFSDSGTHSQGKLLVEAGLLDDID